MAALAIGGKAGFHIALVRVRIDIREHRPAQPRRIQQVQHLRGNRQGGKGAVGDQKRLRDACRTALIGQFGDATGTEFDRGRIGPVGAKRHAVTFFRWKDLGRVTAWKPSADRLAPRPVSLTPVQHSAGSR